MRPPTVECPKCGAECFKATPTGGPEQLFDANPVTYGRWQLFMRHGRARARRAVDDLGRNEHLISCTQNALSIANRAARWAQRTMEDGTLSDLQEQVLDQVQDLEEATEAELLTHFRFWKASPQSDWTSVRAAVLSLVLAKVVKVKAEPSPTPEQPDLIPPTHTDRVRETLVKVEGRAAVEGMEVLTGARQ